MGLDAGFLSMLQAKADLQRWQGKDNWGNEQYLAPETIQCFINEQSRGLGGLASENQTGEQPYEDSQEVYTDSLGIKPMDKLIWDGTDHWVTEVATLKDEFGDDLFQTVTTSTTRRG